MACNSNIVSIRGLCATDASVYYLDDIGLSLVTAAKAADEKYANGKTMIQRKIDMAWEQLVEDVTIDGFQANKVIEADTFGVYTDDTESGTGWQGLNFTLFDDHCPLQRLYLSSVRLKVATGGVTEIRLISDGVTTSLWSGTATNDQVIDVYYNDWVADGFSVEVDMDNITVYTSSATSDDCDCRHGYYSYSGDTSGMQIKLQVRCDKEIYLCQFVRQLGRAWMYKAGAMIWKEIKDSSRFNDHLAVKKEYAVLEMAWLDSSYNLLKYDPSFDVKKYGEGMYQQELEKLKIPVPSSCTCCLECDENGYSITLP